jgi:pilus assembly protein CpaF
MNLDRVTQVNPEEVRREVGQILETLVIGESTPMNLQERERLAQEVLDEVFGLGPLEPLLADPTVSDILVNTYKRVYVERNGILDQASVEFRDDTHLMLIIDRIVSAVGRRVDESSPMVDVRSPPACRGGSDQQSLPDSRDAGAPTRMREGTPEHFDLGRHRRR